MEINSSLHHPFASCCLVSWHSQESSMQCNATHHAMQGYEENRKPSPCFCFLEEEEGSWSVLYMQQEIQTRKEWSQNGLGIGTCVERDRSWGKSSSTTMIICQQLQWRAWTGSNFTAVFVRGSPPMTPSIFGIGCMSSSVSESKREIERNGSLGSRQFVHVISFSVEELEKKLLLLLLQQNDGQVLSRKRSVHLRWRSQEHLHQQSLPRDDRMHQGRASGTWLDLLHSPRGFASKNTKHTKNPFSPSCIFPWAL